MNSYYKQGRYETLQNSARWECTVVGSYSLTCYSLNMNVVSGTCLFSTSLFLLSQKRRLLPFFLLPAQGLCSRDIDQDSWALRYCVSLGMELLCAQSFSHNFSLYGKSKHRNIVQLYPIDIWRKWHLMRITK